MYSTVGMDIPGSEQYFYLCIKPVYVWALPHPVMPMKFASCQWAAGKFFITRLNRRVDRAALASAFLKGEISCDCIVVWVAACGAVYRKANTESCEQMHKFNAIKFFVCMSRNECFCFRIVATDVTKRSTWTLTNHGGWFNVRHPPSRG